MNRQAQGDRPSVPSTAVVPDVVSSAARPTSMRPTPDALGRAQAQGHLFDLGFYQPGTPSVAPASLAEGTSPGPSFAPPPDTLMTIRPRRHTALLLALALGLAALAIAAAVAFI